MDKNIGRKRNKATVSLALVLVTAVITFTVIYTVGKNKINDFSIVASVSGAPIIYREYMQSVITVRADVISYFVVRGADQGSDTFWYTPIDGVIPIESLKKAALEKAVRNKIIQIFGKEKDLIKDISYKTFLNDLKKENKRRESALKSNQPVYGPQQYSERIYYDLTIAGLEAAIKEKLAQESAFSEKEMRRIYEEQWKNMPDSTGKYPTYEQIKGVIRARMSDDEYNGILGGMLEKANVKTNDRVYGRIDNMIIR